MMVTLTLLNLVAALVSLENFTVTERLSKLVHQHIVQRMLYRTSDWFAYSDAAPTNRFFMQLHLKISLHLCRTSYVFITPPLTFVTTLIMSSTLSNRGIFTVVYNCSLFNIIAVFATPFIAKNTGIDIQVVKDVNTK